MRKFTLTALLLLMCLPLISFGQNKQATKQKIATPEMLQHRDVYTPQFEKIETYEAKSMLEASPVVQSTQQASPSGKVSAVSPVQMGRASNAYTILRGEQNQVVADDGLGLVSFIHRHDVTIWGGGGTENGKFRYDVSIDGGATFVNDIGTMQNVYVNFGRYPNISLYNPAGNTNPFAAKAVYTGPTNGFPTPGWVGHVYGVSDITLTNPPATTEQYLFDTENTLLPGGLTEGLPGEFWQVEQQWDGAAAMDSIRVMKGVWNTTTNDVDWTTFAKIDGDYDKSATGTATVVGPNIAFSPDGMDGYIAYLSNLDAGGSGNDSTLYPCFIKTSDGGATWGTPIEANLDDISWIADSLQTLWITVDSVSGDTVPASDGRATCAFDFDVTVDMNGNPHLAVSVGTAGSGQAFSISSTLAMFMADIWSPDGGATWAGNYVSPVLCFRGDFGTGDPISMDNFVQVSRNETGDKIYYSWADTDTSAVTGNQNGIGFGQNDQLAPNLRIAGLRLSDGYKTCPKLVTDQDFIWEGRALYPTMSPTVLTDAQTGDANLPIVCEELITNDPLQPCQFWYFGNDAVITDLDFRDPGSLILNWDEVVLGCPTVDREDVLAHSDITLFQSFPNPTNDAAVIRFELPATMDIQLDVNNMFGQQVGTLLSGEMTAGVHEVTVHTQDLANGVYFYNLRSNDQVLTKKMVVNH